MKIRDIRAASGEEIALVAARMRDTLIEVEGEEHGASMYSLEWLAERVRWHLDPSQTTARVMLAERDSTEETLHGPRNSTSTSTGNASHSIVGHCIVRVDGRAAPPAGAGEAAIGLIVTTYVCPEFRRHGLAARFLQEAEQWVMAHGLSHLATWTSATNTPLIALYQRCGYAEVDSAPNDLTGTPMVMLGKRLEAQDRRA
jgi:GNAT superfamily N-acetyltransferase